MTWTTGTDSWTIHFNLRYSTWTSLPCTARSADSQNYDLTALLACLFVQSLNSQGTNSWTRQYAMNKFRNTAIRNEQISLASPSCFWIDSDDLLMHQTINYSIRIFKLSPAAFFGSFRLSNSTRGHHIGVGFYKLASAGAPRVFRPLIVLGSCCQGTTAEKVLGTWVSQTRTQFYS